MDNVTTINNPPFFNGVDFSSWKFKMEFFLKVKDLWQFVISDVNTLSVTVANTKDSQIKRDELAQSFMVLSIPNDLITIVRPAKTAFETWNLLNAHFRRKGLSTIINLRTKFLQTKMDDAQLLDNHLKIMEDLEQQISELDKKMSENEFICQLLISLPERFNSIRTTLKAMSVKQDMTYAEVKGILLDFDLENPNKNTNSTNALNTQKKPIYITRSYNNNRRKVNHSHKKDQKDSNNIKRCTNCKKEGHTFETCWFLPGRKYNNNNTSLKGKNVPNPDPYAFSVYSYNNKSDLWYLDSGASDHMCSQKDLFHNLKDTKPQPINVAKNDQFVTSLGLGDINLSLDINGIPTKAILKNVLYVPDLKANLISVSKALDAGLTVTFQNDIAILSSCDGITRATARKDNNMFTINLSTNRSSYISTVESNTPTLMDLWHARLGHLGEQNIKILSKGMVGGVNIKNEDLSFCKTCTEGKMTKQPFSGTGNTKSTKLLQLVHSDICGPIPTSSIGGGRYFITFIDDYSHHTTTYILKHKSEAIDKFKEYVKMSETYTGNKIITIRTDNGGEYTSNEFKNHLKEKGISHQLTTAYTPQLNGVAERMNRTLWERAQCMLNYANLPDKFWGEALATATYITNRVPTRSLDLKITPIEAWTNKRPNISHLKVFGCKAYRFIPSELRKKLDQKSEECILVGYDINGYRLWSIMDQKIKISRDVKFNEQSIHQETITSTTSQQPFNPTDIDSNKFRNEDTKNTNEIFHTPRKEISNEAIISSSDDDDNELPRRSNRLLEKSKSQPAPKYVFFTNYEPVQPIETPMTYNDVMKSSNEEYWIVAMQDEIDSLHKNNTWTLTELPPNRNAIGNKWVYKIKTDKNGKISRFKARLVAQGFSQVEGVDYTETYSPVVKQQSLRSILSIANDNDMEIYHLDVKTAFLNAEVEEDIYMKQPYGFVKSGEEHLVCKLNKAIYGLKQASRAWNNKFNQVIQKYGFNQLISDNCIYKHNDTYGNTYIALYVDDLLLTSNNKKFLNHIKKLLQQHFEMTDLGEVQYMLGWEIARNRENRTLTISQEKYINEIVKRFNMENSKPTSIPMDTNYKAQNPTQLDKASEIKFPYREAIGSLMYAAIGTRPDIMYATSLMSRFQENYQNSHITTIKKILSYLNATKAYALTFRGNDKFSLTGYVDADFAGDLTDRKSTTGYIIKLGSNVISWKSKKQPTVSLSTTEAEYIALTEITSELLWFKNLLMELGYKFTEPIKIHEDNQSCIKMATSNSNKSRAKHLDIKYHFIKEHVDSKTIELNYVPTNEQIADTLTKALPRSQFELLRKEIGLLTIN